MRLKTNTGKKPCETVSSHSKTERQLTRAEEIVHKTLKCFFGKLIIRQVNFKTASVQIFTHPTKRSYSEKLKTDKNSPKFA